MNDEEKKRKLRLEKSEKLFGSARHEYKLMNFGIAHEQLIEAYDMLFQLYTGRTKRIFTL